MNTSESNEQEVVAEEVRLPEHEFDLTSITPEEHPELYQRGNFIICKCHGHGSSIPPGKILTKKNGEYALEDEVIIRQ